MVKGIERKIDELGRITIPKEYRAAIGADEKSKLGMYVDNGILHLFKVDDHFIGFARNLDELGRWTLPIEIRRSLNCNVGQKMDIYMDYSDVFDNTKVICIRKLGCSWCDNTDDLIDVNGHALCGKCAAAIVSEVHRIREARA